SLKNRVSSARVSRSIRGGGDGGGIVSSESTEYDDIESVSDSSFLGLNPSVIGDLMGLLGRSKRCGRPLETRCWRPTWRCVEDSQNSFISCSRELWCWTDDIDELCCDDGGAERPFWAEIRSDTKLSVIITAGNRQDPGEGEDFSSKGRVGFGEMVVLGLGERVLVGVKGMGEGGGGWE